MRRTSLLLMMAVVLGAAAITGCVTRPEVTPAAPPPTPVVRVGPADNGQEQDESAMDLASRFPLPAPAGDGEDVEAAARFDDSECISCHTDEEAVKALAVEPEEEEELSEGEG
jgi:hypothetical protein